MLVIVISPPPDEMLMLNFDGTQISKWLLLVELRRCSSTMVRSSMLSPYLSMTTLVERASVPDRMPRTRTSDALPGRIVMPPPVRKLIESVSPGLADIF